MGQGGYLWIINATSKTLKLVSKQSGQMKTWDFDDISSQTQKKFYIEYSQLLSKNKNVDDQGEAVFQVEDTNDQLKLLVRWPYNEGECGLKVDWSGTNLDNYAVFPPPLSGEALAQLGWIQNGFLALLLMEKGTQVSISTDVPGEDTIIAANSTYPYPLTPLYSKWMDHYGDVLGRLTLTELTLPGTHDSGTHDPKAVGIISSYIRTQNTTLAKQLSDGIRVLDLRIGQVKPGEYIIVHDTYSTNYSLSTAIKEVTEFMDKTEKEIVVLDFHRFVNLSKSSAYDYTQLKLQIASELSGYYLPFSEGCNRSLSDIWSLPERRRVVVAWNTSSPDAYMWPGVEQHWYSNAGSLKDLYKVVVTDMSAPPVDKMWAVCSFVKPGFGHTPHKNAELANPTMTRWYFGGSLFCEKANILSVDFYLECTNVVQACIIGSLLKARRKI